MPEFSHYIALILGFFISLAIFYKKEKREYEREWNSIETVPFDKLLELACDSYDCGWTFYYGWTKGERDEDGYLVFYSSAPVLGQESSILHLPPSLWRECPKDPNIEYLKEEPVKITRISLSEAMKEKCLVVDNVTIPISQISLNVIQKAKLVTTLDGRILKQRYTIGENNEN